MSTTEAPIGIVNTSPPHTGTGKYTFRLVEALATLGFPSQHLFMDASLPGWSTYLGTQSTEIRNFRRLPFEHKYLYFWKVARHLPDLRAYHITTQNLSFLPLKPKIITCLDLIHLVQSESSKLRLASRFLYRGMKHADGVIAISEATRNDLVAHYKVDPSRIHVTHLGVDHALFRPRLLREEAAQRLQLPEKRRILLHVSSEVPRKNFLNVLHAFSILKAKEQYSDLLLVKIGAAQYAEDRKRSLEAASRLGIAGDVKFVDRVSESDLALYYRAAEAFIFPSYYEGFGFPALEAMASGTPVVTSDRTSLPEIVGDTGVIVNPDDTKEMALAVDSILADPSFSDDLSKRGVIRAGKFTWEETARKTIAAYRDFGL